MSCNGECETPRRRGEREPKLVPLPDLPFDPTHDVVPIVRRATYELAGRAGTNPQTLVLANGVDATMWQDAQLVVLLHARGGSWTGTSTVSIAAVNVSLTPDAPDVTVMDVEEVATAPDISAATPVPTMTVTPLAPPFGPQLLVKLTHIQGAQDQAISPTFTVTVLLVGRHC